MVVSSPRPSSCETTVLSTSPLCRQAAIIVIQLFFLCQSQLYIRWIAFPISSPCLQHDFIKPTYTFGPYRLHIVVGCCAYLFSYWRCRPKTCTVQIHGCWRSSAVGQRASRGAYWDVDTGAPRLLVFGASELFDYSSFAGWL